jgi:hypothetical protein
MNGVNSPRGAPVQETILTHQDCVKLVGSPERGRYGVVSIDGRPSVVFACLILGNGDLLIPTGQDMSIVRAAAGRPVTVEFTHPGHRGHGGWIVTGTGLARPLRHGDTPRPIPHSTLALATRGVFDNGFRVCIARMTGHRKPAPATTPWPPAEAETG